MKGKTLTAVGLITLIVGVAIAFFYKDITSHSVVLTGGLLFVAVGVANLIIYGRPGERGSSVSRVFTQIANAAAIVLGICMLVFQGTFAPLVSFIFGLLVAVCALWQFFLLAVGTRPYQLHGWLYLFPLLLAAASIYIFLQSDASDEIISLTTGVSVAVMGAGCICEGSALGIARRRAEKSAAESAKVAPAEEEKPAAKAEGAEARSDEQDSAAESRQS